MTDTKKEVKCCETCVFYITPKHSYSRCMSSKVGVPYFCWGLGYPHYQSSNLKEEKEETMQEQTSSDYELVAQEVAELVKQKQKAYGDSFGRSGIILKEMYPNGIKPEQYNDMLTIVRIIDKLFRIANNKQAFGENPYKDINGYSLLAIVNDLKKQSSGSKLTF